jgi:hypothetical protein
VRMASDPSVGAAQRPASGGFDAPERALLITLDSTAAMAAARRVHRWWIYGTLAIASTLLCLRVLASVLAAPLASVGQGAAPAWQVEVTTNGSKPGIALAYGREAGIQLLRIPAGERSASEARVVPARLAQGELHLITLSFNSLRVHSPGAPGSGVVQFSATSPIVTAFHNSKAAGVRTGW